MSAKRHQSMRRRVVSDALIVPVAIGAMLSTAAVVSGAFDDPTAASTYAMTTPLPASQRPTRGRAEPAIAVPSKAATVGAADPVGAPRGFDIDTSDVQVGDIPQAALMAYQRAAVTVGRSATDCDLDWSILAGMGLVESAHGTIDGSALDGDGVARPAIFGPTLNGVDGRPRVRDTDTGALDGEERWDRPVGPMQILPSVWARVGVDGDGDGARDPQDVDDAALGVALDLCSEQRDLSDVDTARRVLAAYHESGRYADDVLTAASAYAASEREADSTGPTVIRTSAPGSSATPTSSPTGSPTNSPINSPTRSPSSSPTRTPTAEAQKLR